MTEVLVERPDRVVSRPAASPRHRRTLDVDAHRARLTGESALIGLAVGVSVIVPWTRPGYLLLLDWVSGPHQTVTPGLYGLNSAALDALPYRLVTQGVREVFGSGATSWLMMLLYFPLAAGGVSALAGGGRWRRHSASAFVCVNPFVIERLQAGHVPFLLSIALLCPMLASASHARRRGHWFAARPAGWYALAMSIGPHAAWLGGVGLLAVAALPRPRPRDLVRTLIIVAAAGCVYAYALAVMATAILTVHVSSADLTAYATHAGPGGLVPTLLTLRGFWRGDADGTPEVAMSITPAAMMVLAAAAGLALLCRRDPGRGLPLVALSAAGLLLGAGIEGPLNGAYRFAFAHLPLFAAMREQQKWVALAMIGYAVGVGVTMEALAAACRPDRPPVPGVIAAGTIMALGAMAVSVGSGLVWGLGGSIRVSHYPADWYTADQMMGRGAGSVLLLPWHEYQPFGFTANRSVAGAGGALFRKEVVSSDAAEVGPVRTNSASRRTAYVGRLVAGGGSRRFGRLVAPLGVAYVLLVRDSREAADYAWLDHESDLRPVLRTSGIVLYRVTAAGTGRVVSARHGAYEDAVRLAAADELGTEAVLPDAAGSGTVPSAAAGGIERTSATRWHVAAGPAGWVVLPEEWSPGWTASGRRTSPTVAGTVAVDAGAEPFDLVYAPWRWLRLGLGASLGSIVALLIAGLFEHWRDLTQWWLGPFGGFRPRTRTREARPAGPRPRSGRRRRPPERGSGRAGDAPRS